MSPCRGDCVLTSKCGFAESLCTGWLTDFRGQYLPARILQLLLVFRHAVVCKIMTPSVCECEEELLLFSQETQPWLIIVRLICIWGRSHAEIYSF